MGNASYLKRCSRCHGKDGQGGTDYPRPLVGTLSRKELAHFISQEMPPGPRKCPAPEADKIAGFIYEAFYSPLAQEKNRPARVELSRLTVRQFKNAVADLVGDYHPAIPTISAGGAQQEQRGLQGEYFKGRDQSPSNRVLTRVDPQVDFDFGTGGSTPNQFDPHTFTAVWHGAVLAPDSGEYEFVVRSNQSIRLWVNDTQTPLIDAWVKSGPDTEFRGRITLLGGRAYPIMLAFSKASQGVDDTNKIKGKPAPPAFVSLRWTRPNHTSEIIASRFLFSQWFPSTFVVTTAFPPDDRSIGYERGNSVSKEWDEAITAASIETAEYISDHLATLSGVQDAAPDRPARLQAYCRKFVERAFRRPLTPEVESLYVQKQFAVAANPETAVKRVVVLALNSPRFLYQETKTKGTDAYGAASALSFGLWDTLPDPELLNAASHGELTTRDQIQRQADRMAADPRAWNKLREFLLRWLKVDEVPDINKNPKLFPTFDASTASDLRTSLELFLESTAWSASSDYRDLLLSPAEFLNGRLANLYGAKAGASPIPLDAPFQAVTLDPDQRSGVLTSPYLLTRFAYLDTSDPIHRGVLIVRNLLGRTLRPPPAAFAPLSPSLHPDLTTRQRVTLQTKHEPCISCHGIINPLGFTLEKFDAIGRLRTSENGHPIDDTGFYRDATGSTQTFSGAKSLARYIANSDEGHAAFVEKLFQHLLKQPIRAYGPDTLTRLQRSFAANRYSIRSLMVQIMMTSLGKKT